MKHLFWTLSLIPTTQHLINKNISDTISMSSPFLYRDWITPQLPAMADVLTYLQAVLLWLLPSHIQSRLTHNPTKPQSTSGIAALDGLRGIACLTVFNEHFSANFSTAFFYGYGTGGNRTMAQWPIIRTFWAGAGMVAVFFVISGYVLSYKPLKHMRANQPQQAFDALNSSILRRGVRLYIPSMAAVLMAGLFSWMGLFDGGSTAAHNPSSPIHFHENTPPKFDGFWIQMWDALKQALRMVSLFYWGRDNITPGDYDVHLWTIPIEFRTSMVLFLVLMGTSRLQQRVRIVFVGAFIIFCAYIDQRDVLLFLVGMFLSEIDMARKERLLAVRPDEVRKDADRILWPILFAVGFYLMSAPVYDSVYTPGYRWVASLIPNYYYDAGVAVESVGAIMIVWAVANSSRLKPLFTNPVASYLGKISYALYLVHGNVIKALLYPILPWALAFTGGFQYMSGLIGAWMIGLAVILPVTIWLSDIFWRGIDIPSVKLARWLESKMTVQQSLGLEDVQTRAERTV